MKQQIHHTYQKKVYSKLKEFTGKNKKYNNTHIVVQVDGKSTMKRDSDRVSERFQNHNIAHFSQASGCTISGEQHQDKINISQFNGVQIPQDSELWQL
jgi:hypothetical protein